MDALLHRAAPPYQLLSLLLQYPDDAVLAERHRIPELVAALPRSAERRALGRFAAWFGGTDGIEVQQAYVETFDLKRGTCLHLTFFRFGDTRRRGLALLRLKRLYAAAGLLLEEGELPDYLPVMLEFAASAPAGVGRHLLAEQRPALEVLRLHLEEARSPYLHLIGAVCAGLPRLRAPDWELVRRIVREGPPSEQVGLRPFAPGEVLSAGGETAP